LFYNLIYNNKKQAIPGNIGSFADSTKKDQIIFDKIQHFGKLPPKHRHTNAKYMMI